MTDRYGRIREALAMGPTPGPWYWIGDSLTHRQFNIYAINGTDKHIATVNNLPVEKLWARDQVESEATAKLITACDPDTIQALLEERDGLAAENARLREALHVVSECGDPCKVILYDEEGIEGWRWTHPDGREWTETGEWSKNPPLHPVARAALSMDGNPRLENKA